MSIFKAPAKKLSPPPLPQPKVEYKIIVVDKSVADVRGGLDVPAKKEQARTVSAMEKLVREHIAKGWKPHGSLAVTHDLGMIVSLIQPMMREQK